MMISNKMLSKNHKKNKLNLKQQCHKKLNENTIKKGLQKKKKTKKAHIIASNHLSAPYIFVIFFITAMVLIAIYYKSILVYCEQAYHTDLFNSRTLLVKEISKQELEESRRDEQNVQKYENAQLLSSLSQPIDVVLPITGNITSNLALAESDKTNPNKEIEVITDAEVQITQKVNIESTEIISDFKPHYDAINHNKPETELVLHDEQRKIQKDIEPIHELLPIVLTSNDKVLFAGDSLMQGVAPYVKKMLFKQYKIESLDLSKQSTGLTYLSAFNWPKIIHENLIADPSIKLLVVFLGANDPWDFPVKGYTKYAKFKSELWEEQYRLRIESILNSAIEHNVQVLWLAAPCMRKTKLNDGMVYLNNLYKSEIEKAQQHFLTTNELLGCTYEKFSNFIEIDKAKIKVRVDDGIHFTPTGQKILAKSIMEKIIYKELEVPHND